jgi:CheY-like chemotaxis protein
VVVLRFVVSDTGIGVPSDVMPLLFEHFVQADSSISRRFGGTGLGLAISRKIVSLMDGDIGAESVENEGSVFWFMVELPVLGEPLSAWDDRALINPGAAQIFTNEPSNAALTPPDGTQHSQAMLPQEELLVLLVEDNAVNRKVVMGMLERLGHRVLVAVDGNEAVALATAYPFRVILMDLHMPHMNGLQATRHIRQLANHQKTPILALSGSAEPDDLAGCWQAGMNGHVVKPVSLSQLRDALAPVLSDTTSNGQAIATSDPLIEETAEGDIDDLLFTALREALGEQELLTVLRVFASDAESLIHRMQDALADHDLKTVAGVARDLCATAGNFGFVGLLQATAHILDCIQIKIDAGAAPLTDAEQGALAVALDALSPAISQALAGLERYFPEQKTLLKGMGPSSGVFL